MGYSAWMVKRAQETMCKRAADAAWVASCGVGMVIGPVTVMMKESGESLSNSDFSQWVGTFSQSWARVRWLSDRNLGRSGRPQYWVHPNQMLSPLLDSYGETLESLLRDPRGPSSKAASLHDRNMEFAPEVLDFLSWLAKEGQSVGFNYPAYEDKAVAVGQRYWVKTQRQLARGLG